MLQGDYSVLVAFLILIPFCYFFVTYSLKFHEKLSFFQSAVEEARRMSCKLKLPTLNNLKFNENKKEVVSQSQKILREVC